MRVLNETFGRMIADSDPWLYLHLMLNKPSTGTTSQFDVSQGGLATTEAGWCYQLFYVYPEEWDSLAVIEIIGTTNPVYARP